MMRIANKTTKRLMALACLLMMTVSMQARQVNEQEAENKARSFFAQQAQKGQRKGAKLQPVDVVRVKLAPEQRRAMAQNVPSSADDAFYIFNRADQQGFVIVSGEDQTREVLAYSLEGPFHPEHLDQGADLFLQFYAEEIESIRSGKAQAVRHNVNRSGMKVLLQTVNLAQNTVYLNTNYAPMYNGRPCLAGCGPVAMATVMAYYRWPETSGEGYESYSTDTKWINLSCDFGSQAPIDWSLIKSGLTDSNSPESNECSRLLYQCGVAMHADYTPDDTNSYLVAMVNALRRVFHYDACHYTDRSQIMGGDEEWNDIIINELYHGRPVVVCGAGRSDRHIFTVTGYDDEMGMYFYNLGWGGNNNGYFSDGQISNNRYLCDGIVYGIKPLREDNLWEKPSNLSLNQIKLTKWAYDDYNGKWDYIPLDEGTDIVPGMDCYVSSYMLMNYGYEDLTGRLRLELHSEDGTLKEVVSEREYAINGLPFNYYYFNYSLHCIIPSYIDLQPTDFICLAYCNDYEDTWRPVYSVDRTQSFIPVDHQIELGIQAPATHTALQPRGIYDLQGRQFPTLPSRPGLIIRDGKKILKR